MERWWWWLYLVVGVESMSWFTVGTKGSMVGRI